MKKMWIVALICLGTSVMGFSQSEELVNEEEVEIAVDDKMEPRDRFMINLTFDNLFHKENDGFETKWLSRGVGLYYMYDIPIKNSRVSIAPGLGFSHSSYYHNSFMVEDSTGTDFNPIANYNDQDEFKRHKLAVNYVEIPVELRFFGKPSEKGNVFKLRKMDRIIGFYLYDRFNELIARIDAALVDSQSYQSFYLVIKLEEFLQVSGRIVVLPVEVCEVRDLGKVKTEWGKESILRAPALIDTKNLTTIE